MILRQQLRPGEKTSVTQLSVAVELGRTPVKLAVENLADEGLMHVSSRRGTYVAELDCAQARQLFELRRIYESAAAELIVERAGSEDVERIEAALGRLAESREAGDGQKSALVAFIDADVAFHAGVIQAAQNDCLLKHYSALNLHLLISTYLLHQTGSAADQRHAEHVEIAEAVVASDADALREALERHATAVETDVLRAMHDERPSWAS